MPEVKASTASAGTSSTTSCSIATSPSNAGLGTIPRSLSPRPARVANLPVLPRGHWGPLVHPLCLDDSGYDELVGCTENILRRLLVTENYDSISNFISLYNAYEHQRSSLFYIYRDFVPVLRPHSSTCVGLALELIRRWQCLERRFPGLGSATGILSCEESAPGLLFDSVLSQGAYELVSPDKEHVMVGIQILLNGRKGLMIADPGYHSARIVTVMVDKEKPHTGWFNQALDAKASYKHDFRYVYCGHNVNYVVWFEDEQRHEKYKKSMSLIYVSRYFCDAICVTEKRNLVYKLKTIVSRTHTGTVKAGLVFLLCPYFKAATFTIILPDQRTKYNFKDFRGEVSFETLKTIEMCNKVLNFPEGKLISIIYRLVEILSDESFVRQCIQLSAYVKHSSKRHRDHFWETFCVAPVAD